MRFTRLGSFVHEIAVARSRPELNISVDDEDVMFACYMDDLFYSVSGDGLVTAAMQTVEEAMDLWRNPAFSEVWRRNLVSTMGNHIIRGGTVGVGSVPVIQRAILLLIRKSVSTINIKETLEIYRHGL